jgi:hypothetical protein
MFDKFIFAGVNVSRYRKLAPLPRQRTALAAC